MRSLFWTFMTAVALCHSTLVAAQNFEQLRQTINANVPANPTEALGTIGRIPPKDEIVNACKTIAETATQIYALSDITEEERRWTLQREALALIVLANVEPAIYYSRLATLSDELDKRGLQTHIGKEAEKHVLQIGGVLATQTGNNPNPLNINVESLAERMVLYAEQYPGADSMQMIDNFLQRIRMLSAVPRDRRLAAVAPVFHAYYMKIHHIPRARALDPDILRSTLKGQPMRLTGVNINGNDFDPSSMRDKVVLLYFWGIWCVNCKEQIPDLITLYEKYRSSGFEIIGINTGVRGDDERTVRHYVETSLFNGKKIPWTIFHEGLAERKNMETLTKTYGITELPAMILIGRNGRVVELHPFFSALDSLVSRETSIFGSVGFTAEQLSLIEEIGKKEQEELDQSIRRELGER